MQFEIQCKQCHKRFAIEAVGGSTLKCICPYCNTSMIVATPAANAAAAPVQEAPARSAGKLLSKEDTPVEVGIQQKKQGRSLGIKVTIIFLLVALVLLLTATLLYIVFSLMSK